jgi:hypothetical protein
LSRATIAAGIAYEARDERRLQREPAEPRPCSRARERGHVLDDAEDADLRAPNVRERDLLRRRDEDRPVDPRLAHEAHDRQMLVARPGRRVDHDQLRVAPVDVLQKIEHEPVLPRAPRHERSIALREEELGGNKRKDRATVGRLEAEGRLQQPLAIGAIEQEWHRRPAESEVEHGDVGKKVCERGLPNTAFAAEDEILVEALSIASWTCCRDSCISEGTPPDAQVSR